MPPLPPGSMPNATSWRPCTPTKPPENSPKQTNWRNTFVSGLTTTPGRRRRVARPVGGHAEQRAQWQTWADAGVLQVGGQGDGQEGAVEARRRHVQAVQAGQRGAGAAEADLGGGARRAAARRPGDQHRAVAGRDHQVAGAVVDEADGVRVVRCLDRHRRQLQGGGDADRRVAVDDLADSVPGDGQRERRLAIADQHGGAAARRLARGQRGRPTTSWTPLQPGRAVPDGRPRRGWPSAAKRTVSTRVPAGRTRRASTPPPPAPVRPASAFKPTVVPPTCTVPVMAPWKLRRRLGTPVQIEPALPNAPSIDIADLPLRLRHGGGRSPQRPSRIAAKRRGSKSPPRRRAELAPPTCRVRVALVSQLLALTGHPPPAGPPPTMVRDRRGSGIFPAQIPFFDCEIRCKRRSTWCGPVVWKFGITFSRLPRPSTL